MKVLHCLLRRVSGSSTLRSDDSYLACMNAGLLYIQRRLYQHEPPSVAKRWKRVAKAAWEQNPPLDEIIRWERRINVARKVMAVVDSKEAQIMSLVDLQNSGTDAHKKNVIKRVVLEYPGIFKFRVDEDGEHWVEFTPEAEDLIIQEKKAIRSQDGMPSVTILRKLLMMAKDHRIGLEKLGHLKHDFFFPDNFKHRLLPQHPEFFKVVKTPKGLGYVELVGWDSALAVTVREQAAKRLGRYAFPVAAGIQNASIKNFQALPFVSPYEDPGQIDYRTMEAEKRAVAVLHELLSLMPMRKAVVGRMRMLTEELQLPTKSMDLVGAYNWIFYISCVIPKQRTVFLRDAFVGSRLKQENPVSRAKDCCKKLMRFRDPDDDKPEWPKYIKPDEEDLEDAKDYYVEELGRL